MPQNKSTSLLVSQWQTIHNSHESYEHYALVIKLLALCLTASAFVFSLPALLTLALIAILWLQEGIWKTFQARAAQALIQIEASLSHKNGQTNEHSAALPDTVDILTLYKSWQDKRGSVVELIIEYISSSVKPTVIYPYLPLMLLVIIF